MAHDPHGGLTGWDLEGFHGGGDTELWRRLGAHQVTIRDDERGEISGTRFAVWAPNAQAVRLNADFNWWTGDTMTLIPGSGVWGLFVEGVGDGAMYKFNILGADGVWREKVDPMATFAEQAPANSSIVYTSEYLWADDEWMQQRSQTRPHESPMSIYEVHLGSWRKGKTYLELAEELVEYVTWQGFTHVELMPVTEHPFEPSWGYQVTNYFAPQSRLGRPDEFRYLVDRLHQAGIGVILDWVPGHFPKDEWALGRFDGSALYEHADPRQGEHKDWGTYIFNYGRNEVKSFLVSNALYWVTEFHIDALRVDAVASMLYLDYSRNDGEWVPNQYGGNENLEAIDFLRYVNKHLYERVPGVCMIAEESTSFGGVTKQVDAGGLGFGFKWNMGWMNDSLRYLALEPIYRQYHHHEMTFAMVYQYSENFVLPISHDEVVHGKGSMINKIPQDSWRQFATLRAFYSFMWGFPGKQLLFMGCEFGQRTEFNEATSLEWWVSDLWGHHGLQRLIKDLNELYVANPALWKLDSDPAGFRWINADDAGGNTFSWVRSDGEGQHIAVAVNFSSEPWHQYKLGLPEAGVWREVLNSDAGVYDGSDSHGNLGQVEAHEEQFNGWDAAATVNIPPLGAVFFRYDGTAEVEDGDEAGEVNSTPEEFQVQLKAAGDAGVLEWSGRASQDVVDRAVSLAADDGLIGRGLRRIEVSLPSTDAVGRRAVHRAGFRLEGTRRQAVQLSDGTFGDVVIYARLADDLVYGPGGFTGVMNTVLPRKRLIAHALITDPWDRVCLLETTFKPDWELPGGIVNPSESPWQGAVREIEEELSLQHPVGRVLVLDWLAPYQGWEDAVELVFDAGQLTQQQIDAIVPDPGEIVAVHWLAPDKAAAKMAPFARGRMLAAVACRLGGGTQYLERGLPRRDAPPAES